MVEMNQDSSGNLKKALFLDRDGVIVNYFPYLCQPEQVNIPFGAGQALKQWQEAGYLLIVITNQSGVNRGYFTLEDMKKVHTHIHQVYQSFGVQLQEFFFCPHYPEEQCLCRKPYPGMILAAAKKYQIALSQSFFIGDAPSDLECAIQGGCQPVLLLTGRGKTTAKKIDQYSVKIPIFEELLDTISLINSSWITP